MPQKVKWKEALIARATQRSPSAPLSNRKNEQEEYEEIQRELARLEIEKEPSLKTIPKFYHPKRNTEISAHVEFVARRRMLRKQQQSLLTHAELEALWVLLAQSVGDQEEEKINYEMFCNVRDAMYATIPNEEVAHAKFGRLFAPSTFLKFHADSTGAISAAAYFDYITRKAGTEQLRIGLSFYDSIGDGYLTEKNLELYMLDQVPTLPRVSSLHKSFYPYYATAAVRKLMFFLDSKSTGRIKVCDLVLSPLMAELEEARELSARSPPQGSPEDVEVSRAESLNWFSARTALRVYGQFVSLDTDRDGLVGPLELMRWGTGTLTEAYARALCSRTKKGKMGFREFIDFVLAIEHKGTPQALTYHFKCLDYMHKGYLTVADINYWFRDITFKLRQANLELIPVEDVRDEIFDMIHPVDPFHITLDDMIRSGSGDVMVGILTDMNSFWLYENRESLVQSDDQQ